MFSFWQRFNETSDEQLRQTFNFDETDLEAHRSGVLSDRQHERFTKFYTSWAIFSRGAALYAVARLAVGLLSNPSSIANMGDVLALSIAGIVAFIFSRRLEQDTTRNTVQAATGTIRVIRKGRSEYIVVHTPERTLRFQSFKSLRGAFLPARQYTLYYLPTIWWIVSIEQRPDLDPITDNKPDQMPKAYPKE